MAKNKPAPKKATQASAGKGNKSILSFLIVPIAFIAVAIAAAGYLVISTQATPVNERHREEMVASVTGLYQAYFGALLKQQQEMMQRLADSPDVLALVQEQDDAVRFQAEKSIAEHMPAGLSAHIFAMREATGQNDTTPPLSHAGRDMIRRTEQGQRLAMEFHQYDGQYYLQSVIGIRDPKRNNSLVGTISVAQDISYLNDALANMDANLGQLTIEQQFEDSPRQQIISYGVAGSTPAIELTSGNPNWLISFKPSNDLAYATIMSSTLLWAIFALLIVATTLPILLTAQRLQQVLRNDANAFARQIQQLLSGGQRTASSEFEFAIFGTLAKSVNRMRMGKLSANPGAQAQAQAPTSVLGSLNDGPQDESENFDVPMMDGDDDLLGMTKPAAPVMQRVSIPKNIFRAYDIRGVVGQSLTADAAVQIGMAIGSEAYDRGEQSIIVGRDGRLSSPELTEALIRGLTASGRDVIDIGMVPTPVCYFACEQLKVPSCIMVTGSHNPGNHNGFKVVLAGNTLADDEITGLYHRIENQNFLTGTGQVSRQDVAATYLTRISSDVKSARPLKVVIDCGNGVAGVVAPQLIKGIGCHVLPLYCDVDGHFPNHHPDPSDARNLQELTKTVVETRADLGLAFDGDGDRIGIVTNSGKVVYADRLLMLLAKQVVQARPGAAVLFDVKSSRRLKNLIIGYGGKPIMWKTGHSFMKRKMKETGAALAGEMSGHVFYQDRWYGFDDALYTAARLIEILSAQNETLDTLLAELPEDISTPEISIGTSDERKFRIIEALQRNGQFAGGQITDIDGVRVDFQDGWGLVRASNTTPKLVCRFEADTEESLNKIQNLFKQQLLAVDSQLQIPF